MNIGSIIAISVAVLFALGFALYNVFKEKKK